MDRNNKDFKGQNVNKSKANKQDQSENQNKSSIVTESGFHNNRNRSPN